jgi:hypothetical protein
MGTKVAQEPSAACSRIVGDPYLRITSGLSVIRGCADLFLPSLNVHADSKEPFAPAPGIEGSTLLVLISAQRKYRLGPVTKYNVRT